ncbi:MAG: sulfatase [Kiritimatiellaeota bacterium]|nr:sulfatase [Kiritimatiellota bacterium]
MKNKPNIVLINCDDLGWGDLGCTGHSLHKTPHLDRLAAEGTRFTAFYQGSPVCSPSRGAMLTGCHPCRIGFDDFDGIGVLFPGQGIGLSKSEETFAEVLKRAGYATHHIGKWHCGDQPEFLPTNHGFDSYYGIPFSNDMGRQGDRDRFGPLPLLRGTEVIEEQPDQRSLTSRYTEECVKIIRAHRDRPFLLYLAHLHVHLPHYVAERFVAESANGVYGGAVACIDWSTGVIMKTLRDCGIDDNTLVLFTSDNGSRCDFGPSNGVLNGVKASTWEGGLRTPLLARWPGHVPAGRVCDTMLWGMDFLPTFAALSGETPQTRLPIDGVDASDVLMGSDRVLHETFPYYSAKCLSAVRRGDWKLHVARSTWYGGATGETSFPELYNLKDDIGETKNLAADYPEIVATLMKDIEHYRAIFGDANTGALGTQRRPIGRIANPAPLTVFDPACPYYQAAYDLWESG